MKFVVIFSALFVAYVQANVAFDRSAIEHSTYPILTSKGIEYRYGGLDHLGYSLYHNQDILGQYNFGYDTINNKRTEARDALGNVVGSYSYVDAEGKVQTVNYRADERGFNVAGTTIPDASSVVANLETVPETEEVKLAREAHMKAYEDFVAGKYVLPVAPEVPAVPAVPDVPIVPEVPELRQIEDVPEVALAKKEFLEKYDATVALLKSIESGEYVVPTPASIELPQPVSDEPAVALAKKEHNEYREALKLQYEALEKLAVAPVVPIVRDAGIIPTPIVAIEGQLNEALIAPTVVPEVKSFVSEKSLETLVAPVSPIVPLLPSASYIAPALKSVDPIVAEGKVHEPLIASTYPSFPFLPSSYIAPSLKSVSPITVEGKVHEPLIAGYHGYLPHPSLSLEGKSIEGKSLSYNPYYYPYYPFFPYGYSL